MYDGSTSVRTLQVQRWASRWRFVANRGIVIRHYMLYVISQEVGRWPPDGTLFSDDLVICENTRELGEEQLDLWRKAIENKEQRVSRSKTEYLPLSSYDYTKLKLGGYRTCNDVYISRVDVWCRIWIHRIFQNSVRLAWNKWIRVTCDKKVLVKLKHNIYKTVIHPTMA